MKQFLFSILLVGWCFVSPVFAQVDSAKGNTASQTQQVLFQEAFEGPVDPDKYILGPGDELAFIVSGTLEAVIPVVVGPEGIAQITTVGEVVLNGLTLTKANDQIVAIGRIKYPNATKVSLRLVRPRLFWVSISGAAEKTGRYVVSSLTRCSDLLELAGGAKFTEAIIDTTPDGRPIFPEQAIAALRGLPLIHQNGDTTSVDLELFHKCGDNAKNPVLSDGDMLYVPYWSSARGSVRINGAVYQPVTVRYTKGDRLRTILQIAGGIQPSAKGVVELVRIDNIGNRERLVFDETWYRSNDPGPELKPDDQVFVPFRLNLIPRGIVTVQGEVKFPGDYPVDEKSTKLSDVLQAAGGLTDRANSEEVSLVRRTLMMIPDPEYNRLFGLKREEMNWTEYEYLKAKRRDLEPKIVVDVAKLAANESEATKNVVLFDGDVVRVPRKIVTVKVLGQVTKPGLVVFESGKSFKYYIEQAGGYTFKAYTGKIRIIKAQSGQWLKAKSSTPIDVGDTIFIPEKPETDWWASYKDAMLVLSQLATLYLVYHTVTTG
ncbi:MAG: SLBB domain-containing protein [bacterium]|nr:SLBB domain-containing protein [bacterium]